MPVNRDFDPESGIMTVTVAGAILLSDAIEVTEGMYRDPRFQEPTRVLWDLREGSFNWEATELRQYANYVLRSRAPGRGRAAVLTLSTLEFGLSRMYEAYAEGTTVEIRIWRSYDEARNWLLEEF